MKKDNLSLIDIEVAQQDAIKLSFSFFRIIEKKLKENKDQFISFDLSSLTQSQRSFVVGDIYNLFYHCLSMDTHLSYNAKKQLLVEQITNMKNSFSSHKKSYQDFANLYREKIKEINDNHLSSLKEIKQNNTELSNDYWDDKLLDYEEEEILDIKKTNSLASISLSLSFKEINKFTHFLLKQIDESYLLFIEKSSPINNLKYSNDDLSHISLSKTNIKSPSQLK